MRILLILLATACLTQVAVAQVAEKKIIIRGSGAPPAGRCKGLKEVGTEYVNTAPGGVSYLCSQPTANTFTWVEVGSGGGGSPTGSAGGDLAGTYPNPVLGNSGVSAGTYGSSSQAVQVQVDAKGRITSISNQAISSGVNAFQVTRTSGTVLGIAAGIARIGGTTFTYSAATGTLGGTSATGTAYIYIDSLGVLTIGHNTVATVTCSGCVTATGVSALPEGSTPIATATFTSNAWDVSGITDQRAFLSRTVLNAGTNCSISVDPVTGANTISCGSAAFAARRYMPWGNLSAFGENNTTAFSGNESRWQQFTLPVAMTAAGIGIRVSAGLGAGQGVRFAIADTSGAILYKSAAVTTCAAFCEGAFPSTISLPAGNYYFGITASDGALATAQINQMSSQTMTCALVNSNTAPQLAGTGTAGSGTGGSVDFGASMGTITYYPCNGGTNTLIAKFHDMYLY